MTPPKGPKKRGTSKRGGGPPALAAADLRKYLDAIEAAPSSPDARLVLSDWLQGKGHPWGELIAVQHALATEKDKKRRAALEESEWKLLRADAAGLGPIATEHESLRWRAGFIESASLYAHDGPEMARAIEALFATPASAVLGALILDAQPASLATHSDWDASLENIIDPWDEPLAALAGSSARVPRVGFGASPPEPITAYVTMPDFARVSRALPRVKALEIAGAARTSTGPLELPELVSLEVRFAEVGAAALAAIANSRLPKLERMSIWLGGAAECLLDDLYGHEEDDDDDDDDHDHDHDHDHGYPATFDADDLDELEVDAVESEAYGRHVAEFLGAWRPAGLKELGVESAVLDSALCRSIVGAPVLAQLERLDLSGGELRDGGVLVLTGARAKLSHLKRIDLSRMAVSEEHAARIRAALPNAVIARKRSTSPDFFFRYVATME